MVHRQWIWCGVYPARFTLGEPFVESFNSRLRDEFLNIELFASLSEAKELAERHRMEYNTYRSHSALQGRMPLEVLQLWKAA